MEEKKEITKGKFKLIVWGLLGLGLIINAICYTYLTFAQIGETNLRYVGILFVGGLLVGAGIGLAYARVFKIRGIDI